MSVPLLSAKDLSIHQGQRLLLDRLELQVCPGECWALLGRNGAGKTTLLHSLAGVRPLSAGQLRLQGEQIASWPARKRAQVLGLLTQDASEGFEETVLEAAMTGRHPHIGRWSSESETDEDLARKSLIDCGLRGFEQRSIQSLSGGERRRLALATLLTQNPQLMLLDEPLNHLDMQWQWCMLEQLRALADQARGLIMSLHDPNLALRFCTHALMMDGEGGWAAGPVNEVITADALQRAYGLPMRLIEDEGNAWVIPDQARFARPGKPETDKQTNL